MLNKEVIDSRVSQLIFLESQVEELEKSIEEIKDSLKKHMEETKVYFLEGEGWKITWNSVSSNRFDQSLFKELNPDLFNKYIKLSESRRFLLKKEEI